jgi:hypothetical protein
MTLSKFFFTLSVVCFATVASAQISEPGTPWSFTNKNKSIFKSSIDTKFFAKPDIEAIVYSGIQREPSAALVALVAERTERPRVLFHLSDEKLRHRNRIYSQFDLVVRNYFDPRLAWSRNVVFFPLGWTEAFAGPPDGNDPAKAHLWSFCGAKKASRDEMVTEFSSLAGGFLHLTSGWNSEDQLPAIEVRKVYSNSVFVLCPFGNAHFDTFRIMEALQAGAIPVVVKFLGRDFAKYTFGKHPFLVADSWREAAVKIEKLSQNPVELQELQSRTGDWYQSYLSALVEKARIILSAPRSREARSPLVEQARAARLDLVLIMSVARRFRRYRK